MSDAWDLASEAARAAGIELRPLTSIEHADEIIRVMAGTWGPHQTLPREEIVALSFSGNVPFGAVDGDQLVGFVLGWAGVDDDGLHVHSHMLAALPDRRHKGVGYALKLAQRAQCLDRDIHTMRWTFDPLVSRNAHFNLQKLGALGDRFVRNFYGRMDDVINRGQRSDRLVVRWDLDRAPGPRGLPPEHPTAGLFVGSDRDPAAPARRPIPDDAAGVTVVVPREHEVMRVEHPELADAWRDAVADVLDDLFARGMVPVAFDGSTNSYVFVVRGTIE
jgi:predicted GNAT superfamily acetyltransferase